MAMRDWVRLPSAWIEQGGLRRLRWSGEEPTGSDNIAALMVLSPIAHNADDEGMAKCTYDQLCLATGLSLEGRQWPLSSRRARGDRAGALWPQHVPARELQ